MLNQEPRTKNYGTVLTPAALLLSHWERGNNLLQTLCAPPHLWGAVGERGMSNNLRKSFT